MMDKLYITANDLLLDAYQLGINIYDSGFHPDFIVGVWRGGTPVAIAVHEIMTYFGVASDHIAIRTSAYSGIGQHTKKVAVYGLEYLVRYIHYDHKLLLVDDVYDSGRSLQAVIKALQQEARRNTPQDIRIATPWYKPKQNETGQEPDYYLYSTTDWLVFPHELVGLTEEEILRHKPELSALLSR